MTREKMRSDLPPTQQVAANQSAPHQGVQGQRDKDGSGAQILARPESS